MKNLLFIATCITIISCGSPKQRYDRLIRKYPYLYETDTVIVKDTIIKEIKVPITEYKDSFIIQCDTFIETKKLIVYKKGNLFGVTVKPDTITFRDTVAYEVKVAGKVITKEFINWWYITAAFVSGILVALYMRR